MPPVKYSSINELEENNPEIYMNCTEVLLRIARNILKEPKNPKYRSISLGSSVVTNKLLPASGAMQCLFEMGFQEGSDNLILPLESSLDSIKIIHDELLKRRELKQNKNKDLIPQIVPTKPIPRTDLALRMHPLLDAVTKEVTQYLRQFNNKFFDSMINNIVSVWRCESIPIMIKALNLIPLVDLKMNVEKTIKNVKTSIKKKEIEDQIIDYQEMLLFELCKWFKKSFFTWVNNPECVKCGNKETNFVEYKVDQDGNTRIEVYSCPKCSELTLFPRYNDAEKLLESRRGRCGEWARCFYLFCRSLGWDMRFISDSTDHVWVEMYSGIQKKWIHCDPCENVIDAPLMYECGWKKKLSYIIAYSKDEIQDVTWRYSCNHSQVLKNRDKYIDNQLVDVICNIRRILLSFGSESRKQFVTKRTALELVELSLERSPTDGEKQGRVSGSLAWRLARGETSIKFVPFVWKIGNNDKFCLSYCTSSDEYSIENEKNLKGWSNGLYKMDSVFRKEEEDWKTVYLARQEGSERGIATWRFEVEGDKVIDKVEVRMIRQTYENGRVICKLCDENSCVMIPKVELFSTEDFRGSKQLELSVELAGGMGDCAWQHAQLFRQSLSDLNKTLEISITFA